MTLNGLCLGVIGAYGASRLLQNQVFGLGKADPVAFGLSALVLVAVALCAMLTPARRALRTDPIVGLRGE